MIPARQKFPVPAFGLIDAILAVTEYNENGYSLTLRHDWIAPNEVWIEARSTTKGRTGELIFGQCWRAAVITLEEDKPGETTAVLSVGGDEGAAQWEIFGGSEEDGDESTYLLHQISFAHTAALVIANWWGGAIRQWWDRLNTPAKGPARDEDAPLWNTAAIRDLLNAAFGDEELMTLCFDHFRQVYDDFALGMSKGQKVQRLLDYCGRQEQVDDLLAAVRKANPKQYQRFEGQLTG